MTKTKLVSSDLNGTLVHQHTMSDMIHIYLGDKKFRQADALFKRQTLGLTSMKETFAVAGPLTKGLTLRQAIEYTYKHMKYVDGFSEFINYLRTKEIPFIINSTGYSVTIYAIQASMGIDKIRGFIGNYLKFAYKGKQVSEDKLRALVFDYISKHEAKHNQKYDEIEATGEIVRGIKDEAAKAKLLLQYARQHFPAIKPEEMVHIGDTMGDYGGIRGIAQKGGIGIAFNYNKALEKSLKRDEHKLKTGKIFYINKKGTSITLKNLIHLI